MERDSWLRMERAIRHYENHGFNYVNLPWTAPDEVIEITKPKSVNHLRLGNDALVGSAEQSFLSVYPHLGNDLYYAITPCFRDEREDFLHQKYFIKLELFSKDTSKFLDLIIAAWTFFLSEVPDANELKLEEFNINSKDILYRGTEIGSYYNTCHGGTEWTCGTGLAEPRFIRAINI